MFFPNASPPVLPPLCAGAGVTYEKLKVGKWRGGFVLFKEVLKVPKTMKVMINNVSVHENTLHVSSEIFSFLSRYISKK